MKTHTVLPGQSLFDVAVLRYGSVEGTSWLVEDNEALSGPTDRIYEGQSLLLRDEIINNRMRQYLQDYPTIATISAEDQPEGVGFWRLDEYVVQ